MPLHRKKSTVQLYTCENPRCPKRLLGHPGFKTKTARTLHQCNTPECKHLYDDRRSGKVVLDPNEQYYGVAAGTAPDPPSSSSGISSPIDSPTSSPPDSPTSEPDALPSRPVTPSRRKGRRIEPDQRARVEDALDDNPVDIRTGKDRTIPAQMIPGKTWYDGYKDTLREITALREKPEGQLLSHAPFASKLDWEFSSWLLSEEIGQNTAERLFSVDGVSIFCHFYHIY